MDTTLHNHWPDALESYNPVETLASGRISTVVRATENASGRDVALKILHDHLADEKAVRRRLRREFAAVRRLDHPAIVRADDLIETDDTVALVMEYVDGESMRQRVEHSGPIGWDEARPIIDDVLAGLDQAHRRGILHRDLNAEHVLIDADGRGHIVGFGIARVDELVALTMHTQVLGSLEAMAPERVLGMDYDGRADLYSVGAVAHEMLLGHPPADGTMRAAFANARRSDRSAFDANTDQLPDDARYLLDRSLVTDAGARFATADQMRRAIDGHYNQDFWHRWASRHTDSCPECDAPVIDGVHTCTGCGHQFQRLVQNPGGGDHVIKIISHRENFEPDVWFERNPEPDYLRTDTFQSLMELLGDYEDTKQIADFNPEFRWPPYILLDGLDERDADRISELLDDRRIPHRVHTAVPTRWNRLFDRISDKLQTDVDVRETLKPFGIVVVSLLSLLMFGVYVDPFQPDWAAIGAGAARIVLTFGGLAILTLLLMSAIDLLKIGVTAVAGTNRQNFATLSVVVTFAIVISLLRAFVSVPTSALTAASGAFLASLLATRFGTTILQRRFDEGVDRPTIHGLPVMLPVDSLEAVDLPDDTIELPSRTARVLNNCHSREVRRELHELLVLAVAAARGTDAEDPDALVELVDAVLDAGQRLDELSGQADTVTTAELYDELETIEAALADDDADADADHDELLQRRDELLERLEEHDRTVRALTHCRTTLQLARGSLLDILADDNTTDPPVMLDFGDDGNSALTGLAAQLESETELEQLATVGEQT